MANPTKHGNTIWPSHKGYAIDENHYIPDDNMNNVQEEEIWSGMEPDDDFWDEDMDELYPGASDYTQEQEETRAEVEETYVEAEEDADDVVTLQKGTVVMRYGYSETSKSFTDVGMTRSECGLDENSDFHREEYYFRLEEDIQVHRGTARAWEPFNAEGGAPQYEMLGGTTISEVLYDKDHPDKPCKMTEISKEEALSSGSLPEEDEGESGSSAGGSGSSPGGESADKQEGKNGPSDDEEMNL